MLHQLPRLDHRHHPGLAAPLTVVLPLIATLAGCTTAPPATLVVCPSASSAPAAPIHSSREPSMSPDLRNPFAPEEQAEAPAPVSPKTARRATP